jgi:ABC-type amino acid transport substrate-binding protein
MRFFLSLLVLFCALPAAADSPLKLGNEKWPPFVTAAGDGSAERIVREALGRAGIDATVELGDWEDTLAQALSGALDGIAAIWFTPERGTRLRFSSPYLTNRLVPVTRSDGLLEITGLGDLANRRVALEAGFAYGAEIDAARGSFQAVEVRGFQAALEAVRDGAAEVALVDELNARAALAKASDLVMGRTALAFRELHFAMSREHPREAEIVAAFNRAYQEMLRDGTVNEILDIDWVVTDLGKDGVLDFVHRGVADGSFSDSLNDESVYPIGQAEYTQIQDPGFVGSNAKYLADDTEYQTPEAAMRALDTGRRCSWDSLNARFLCAGR